MTTHSAKLLFCLPISISRTLRLPYMAILGPLIMPMIKSHECAGTHEQVVSDKLKGAILEHLDK